MLNLMPPATPLIDGAVACGAPANGRSARRAMVMSPANQPPRDARPPEGAGPLVAKSEGQVLRGPRVAARRGSALQSPPGSRLEIEQARASSDCEVSRADRATDHDQL